MPSLEEIGWTSITPGGRGGADGGDGGCGGEGGAGDGGRAGVAGTASRSPAKTMLGCDALLPPLRRDTLRRWLRRAAASAARDTLRRWLRRAAAPAATTPCDVGCDALLPPDPYAA